MDDQSKLLAQQLCACTRLQPQVSSVGSRQAPTKMQAPGHSTRLAQGAAGKEQPIPGQAQPHGQQGPVMWTPSLCSWGLHDALHAI